MFKSSFVVLLAASATFAPYSFAQNKVTPEKEAAMKADLAGEIDHMQKQAQVMVDSVFSFGELGFQEFETTRYLTGILEKEWFQNRAQLSPASRLPGSPVGAKASRLSRSAPISTISRRRRRSPASATTIPSWKAHPVMAKATTPASR